MLDEIETPYRKGSQKKATPKATHKHEYLIVFAMNHIRRFDGSISTEKYKFTLPPQCVECGHTIKITKRTLKRDFTEMEVTPKEFRKMREER